MLKSIQRSEVTLVDFMYAPYPSYSFAICHDQICNKKYTKSVDNCGSMSIIVDIGSRMACKTLQYSIIWICVCDISICVCNIWICVCNISICVCNISICVWNISICVCNISICVCNISICVCNIWICVCNFSICVCNISICVCNISICVCNISICVCNFFDMCVQLFRYVWNAKLTETQIFRELSIEIESSLFN